MRALALLLCPPAGCYTASVWLCHAGGIYFWWGMGGEMREFELLFSHHTGEAVAFDFAQSTAVTIFIVLVNGRKKIHFVFFVPFVVGFNPHHTGEWLKAL